VSLTVVCVESPTTTAVGSSSAPSVRGQQVTFTATVSATGGGAGTPVGQVTFKDGATTLGTRTLGADGKATLETSSLSVGDHAITADYAGAADFSPSSGSLAGGQRVDEDTDADGTADDTDTDDDGDGVPDATDAFRLDNAESIDTDGDGTGNNADTDDDGDGVPDASDAFPLDDAESADTDGDGVGDNADPKDGRVRTRLAISHRRVTRSGAYVELRLLCRGAARARCAGIVTLDSAKGKSRLPAAAARGRYGKAKFDIAAGTDTKVRVRAAQSLRKALRAKRRVIAKASATFLGLDGAKLRIERRITIVEPRPAKSRPTR
jgi:hypothetical protein